MKFKIVKTIANTIGYIFAGSMIATCGATEPTTDRQTELTNQRHAMVRQIEQHVRETAPYLGRETLDPRVIAALTVTPRHEFVPATLADRAYEDRPLPIGNGQTISQPYIVAIMTDLLDLNDDCVVLDVGTGSGYQAAILAALCKEVWSIEIVPPLGRAAADRLTRLGYANVDVRIGDGFAGWPEHAPFDGIVVAATGDALPPPLLAQLKPGGRIIMPLRRKYGETLIVATKDENGAIETRDIMPVRFVPLTRDTANDGVVLN